MIEQFDGVPFADGTVNGKLTVSENIADAGGLSCALEAAMTEDDYSAADFFMNWATIWRTKAKKRIPTITFTNRCSCTCETSGEYPATKPAEFYETFTITEEDPMYLST